MATLKKHTRRMTERIRSIYFGSEVYVWGQAVRRLCAMWKAYILDQSAAAFFIRENIGLN